MGTYQCICDDGYQQTGLKSHCEGKQLFSQVLQRIETGY